MTEDYEYHRQKGLKDNTIYSDSELLKYEISGNQGGGIHNPDTYTIKQHPFPEKSKETIDVRKYMPELGEQGDV